MGEVHFSIGLLRERRPTCRYHGNTMRLHKKDGNMPIWHSASNNPAYDNPHRKIYRCTAKWRDDKGKLQRCPVVANGPTRDCFTDSQREHCSIPHYKEAR